MREDRVEKALAREVKACGGRSYKFVSPGRRGVPDRLNLFPVPKEHQEIVNKYVQFVECKAPGETPEDHQLREHARLRALGFFVSVRDHA